MVSGLNPQQLTTARERLGRLFDFLREFDRLRHPVIRETNQLEFSLWLDQLPEHASIERGWLDDEADFILRVTRPVLHDCPEPPRVLEDWLEHGWQDPDTEVIPVTEVREPALVQGDEERVEQFNEDPERVSAFRSWLARREQWAEAERPARQAMTAFERLYRLHGVLDRERERFELYAGDAVLDWATGSGRIHHPIVLQAMQLDFEAALALPRFTITLGDRPPELYTALLRAIDEIDGRVLGQATEEFEQGEYGPFSGAEIDGFLQGMAARLHTQGRYVGYDPAPATSREPSIARRPLLFLRQRTQGFAVALDAIARDLPERDDLPNSLLSIVGIDPPASPQSDPNGTPDPVHLAHADPDILFTKPANEEQAQIARRLERHGAVMVQGPPGTGKTHTIANLVGHLLAQGKRVLVTSHTSKALERVREVIVEDLQPLTVSVTGGDAAGRAQLEQSVQAITDRLSSDNPEQLRAEAARLRERRNGIIEELTTAREALRDALASEYNEIIVDGRGISPSDAAREVARGIGRHDWIPGPVIGGSDLALTVQEILTLYGTNTSVTAEHERELAQPLPPLDELLEPEHFQALVKEEQELASSDLETGQQAWTRVPSEDAAEEIARLATDAEEAAHQIRDLEEWEVAILDAGMQAGGHRRVWEDLVEVIGRVESLADAAAPAVTRLGARLPETQPLEEVDRTLAEIGRHVSDGGSLSRWVLLTHRKWAGVLNACDVDVGNTHDLAAIAALASLSALERERSGLRGLWQRTAVTVGMPADATNGPSPERGCGQFVPRILELLRWHEATWGPLVDRAAALGLDIDSLVGLTPPRLEPYGELRRLVEVAGELLPVTLVSCSCRLRLDAVRDNLASRDDHLARFDRGAQSADVVPALRAAVRSRRFEEYEREYARLVDLHSRTRDAQSRTELLTRLERFAPAWASAIRQRRTLHGAGEPPSDITEAWRWRVLSDELERRAATDTAALMTRIEQFDTDLRNTTAQLVNRLAWASQLERTSLQQRQNLVGWMQAMSRVGRGTGRRAPRLLAAAREYMASSRTAVPVWVMPLARVVETFDFRSTRFDVVIIDEASQSDVMAMAALYLAEQVVVVGDHEQVSPEAVGQRVDQFERLIDQFLGDIPNRELYDGRASIYDFGLSSFGGLVQLREHFRCAPDIIEFSNQLSYRGSILPLRDASDVTRRPHVVAQRVSGVREGDINHAEAEFIVSAILAACQLEEYEGATFGVISMLADRQAQHIDAMLRSRMAPAEFAERRILVGSPPQFQGDERDVVFLSVVDSPTGGPLAMRRDDRFKKRYNVAASRARDQMWVVHSLDPERDLQPGDLRERLTRHAQSPSGVSQQVALAASKADSPFEEAVAEDLIRAGYRIEPQYKVGAFRIDLVVHGEKRRRVAIECDGDRYHTRDDLARDLSRQALLERLGWRFVRIRGSEYYRDPDSTMARVRERLSAMGVQPTSNELDDEPVESDLLERVRARAAAIRAAWEAGDDELEDMDDFGSFAVELAVEAEADTDLDDESSAPLRAASEGVVVEASGPAEGGSGPGSRVAPVTTTPQEATSGASSLQPGLVSNAAPATTHSTNGPVGPQLGTPRTPVTLPHGRSSYIEWTPTTQVPDPRDAPQDVLVQVIVDIVGTEGPVIGWRVYRLLNRAAGGQRLGKLSVRALNRAAASAIRSGLIVSHNPIDQPGQAHLVLRSPDTPSIIVRERGPRVLDEMPPDEVAALAQRLRRQHPGAATDDVKRRLLDSYGWHRLTTGISGFLDRCLALEVDG